LYNYIIYESILYIAQVRDNDNSRRTMIVYGNANKLLAYKLLLSSFNQPGLLTTIIQ